MTTDPMRDAQRGAIPADSFAARLMLARMHAGHLSIRDAAEKCALGRGAWTNWEKGALPSDIIGVATVIADKLGLDRDWLLFGGSLSQEEARSASQRGARTPIRDFTQVTRLAAPALASTPRRASHRPSGQSPDQRRPISVPRPGRTMPSTLAA